MSVAQGLLTYRQFELLDFDRPAELVRGEIVEQEMPGSHHGSVCAAIVILLGIWNRSTRLGSILSNDSFLLVERNPDTVRGPDCGFIRWDRLPLGKLPQGTLQTPLDLAVEVISPSDNLGDVAQKVTEYLVAGVREVWVVDPESRTVDIHSVNQPTVRLTEADTLTRPDLLPGFSCVVAEFFADI